VPHSYSYCIEASSEQEAAAVGARAEAVFGDGAGWGMGGRLSWLRVSAGCNVTVKLVKANDMSRVDENCKGQSTCQVGNTIALSVSAWGTAPATWQGGLDGYRGEMINHEIGHWLGFEHSSCKATPGTEPILQSPTVVIGGCSPRWYALPAETQGTKVLPGF
jgi:hypothetical protein